MATASGVQERRSEKLDLRISPSAKARLQAAAAAMNRPVSEFVLESALVQADMALADRNEFLLDAATWQRFQDALDTPVRAMPRMKRLLSEPGILD